MIFHSYVQIPEGNIINCKKLGSKEQKMTTRIGFAGYVEIDIA